ncbi:MAG: tetratricopeptide repeat protein, partial [Chitinophagaceae bacterium]|nr:tetratricopeptide repeat protein [Chitinophagaceae bacterium]
MKRIALIISFFSITVALFAQKTNKAKALNQRAHKEYLDERYSYAIAFYNAAARYVSPDSLVLHRLAESYYQIKEYDSAYHSFDQLYQRYPNDEKIMHRRAELLANKKKYEEAIAAFAELAKRFPSNPIYQHKYIGLQNRAQFFIDSLDYSLGFLKINSPQSDFSPQILGRNLVFVSNRYYKKVIHKQFGWDALPFAHIYKVTHPSSIIVLE